MNTLKTGTTQHLDRGFEDILISPSPPRNRNFRAVGEVSDESKFTSSVPINISVIPFIYIDLFKIKGAVWYFIDILYTKIHTFMINLLNRYENTFN